MSRKSFFGGKNKNLFFVFLLLIGFLFIMYNHFNLSTSSLFGSEFEGQNNSFSKSWSKQVPCINGTNCGYTWSHSINWSFVNRSVLPNQDLKVNLSGNVRIPEYSEWKQIAWRETGYCHNMPSEFRIPEGTSSQNCRFFNPVTNTDDYYHVRHALIGVVDNNISVPFRDSSTFGLGVEFPYNVSQGRNGANFQKTFSVSSDLSGGYHSFDLYSIEEISGNFIGHVYPNNQNDAEVYSASLIDSQTFYKEPNECSLVGGNLMIYYQFFPSGSVITKDSFNVPIKAFCHSLPITKIDSNEEIAIEKSYTELDMLELGSSVTVPEGEVWRIDAIIDSDDFPTQEVFVCPDGYEFDDDERTCVPSFVGVCSDGQFDPELGVCSNGVWQPCLSGRWNFLTNQCESITGTCPVINGVEPEVEEVNGMLICSYNHETVIEVPSEIDGVAQFNYLLMGGVIAIGLVSLFFVIKWRK